MTASNKLGKWKDFDDKLKSKPRRVGRAAARLFAKKGFAETSMDEIAAASKVSKGGMYYYFQSKSEVLFFILIDYMELLLDHLEEDLASIAEEEDKLKFIITRHIEMYTKNVYEVKTLLHEAHCLPPKYFKVIAANQRRYFQIMADIISELRGVDIKKSDLNILTFLLFGECNWIYWWYDPKGDVSPKELSKTICETFLDGIRKSPAKSKG